ncbi:MAG: CoA-binding protein [Alphaproteobacteria bacterium]
MTDFLQIARESRSIALVGASNKPERPSYGVMRFLLARGYAVHPVNPGLAGQELQGRKVYASLADVPAPVDMVDIFRNTQDAARVIDEAIALKDALGIRTVWCQLGVTPVEAGRRAEAAGLTVVMDRCPAIEWR